MWKNIQVIWWSSQLTNFKNDQDRVVFDMAGYSAIFDNLVMCIYLNTRENILIKTHQKVDRVQNIWGKDMYPRSVGIVLWNFNMVSL